MREEKAILNRYREVEINELFNKWLFYQQLINDGENITLHLKELKKPVIITINTIPDEH